MFGHSGTPFARRRRFRPPGGGRPPSIADLAAGPVRRALAALRRLRQGESGEVIEAFDGGELIKSLMASQSAQGEKMAKAMSGVVSIIDKQGQLIKSLVEQVAKLSSQGGGRKSALSVHDRAAGQGSSSGGGGDGVMTTREVLAKAVALREQGRGGITGHDIAVLETMANRGEQVSEQLVLRIKAAFAS